MSENPPDRQDQSSRMLDGILKEMERFEKIQESAEPLAGHAGSAKPASAGKETLPYLHVRVPPAGWNPAFKGAELARFEPGNKLEEISPASLSSVSPIPKDALIAARDPRKKTDFVPGENVVAKIVNGKEEYYAKARGVVVIIGNAFHVKPIDIPGRITVRIAANNQTAYLDLYPAAGEGRAPDWEMAMEVLGRARVSFGIQEISIRGALAECGRGKVVTDVPAAKGLPPRAGLPGSVEFFFDRDFQGPVNLEVGADGKIDYRNVKWIPIVAKDQLLAKVKRPVPGLDGMDIFGNNVAAKQPPDTYLVPGKNVRAENDGCEFYSEINGCVQLNGTLLEVMNVFVVNSDVDYHSGNIRFDGNVLVTGTVRKGFEVEAAGDVVVLQNAEPSRIKAGRDVLINGGILGAGKGDYRIEAGRNITAGYAENAWLEGQGDIRIENFAMQSFLYSCGRIILEKKRGSLVGGEAMAARGLEAKVLGSQTGVRTTVAAGVDFAVKRKLEQLGRQRKDLNEAAAKVDRMIKSLVELANHGTLPPSKIETLKLIVGKRKLMTKAIHAVATRIHELEGMLEGQGPVQILVGEAVYPEVILSIRGRIARIGQPMFRAVFRLDDKQDRIVHRPA